MYPALLPLMRTPRLPAVDWTEAPADLNGLLRFAERRNLVSARVLSHFRRILQPDISASNMDLAFSIYGYVIPDFNNVQAQISKLFHYLLIIKRYHKLLRTFFRFFMKLRKIKNVVNSWSDAIFFYFWPLYCMIWYKFQMMVGWSAGWYDVKTALRKLRRHWNSIIHWGQTYLK
jgi:hypothetical protein